MEVIRFYISAIKDRNYSDASCCEAGGRLHLRSGYCFFGPCSANDFSPPMNPMIKLMLSLSSFSSKLLVYPKRYNSTRGSHGFSKPFRSGSLSQKYELAIVRIMGS